MTQEHMQIVERLYHEALSREGADRAAFLDQECKGDENLRSEVESLIRYAHNGDGFMDRPALQQLAPQIFQEIGAESDEDKIIGKQVAEYRIVAKIGEGGMGGVYRAVRADSEYEQQVAIKLVHVGHHAELVVSRFRSERQILAGLDHPNIARLLDGGTTQDGIPFFVMELIEGQAIDRYCATHKLSVEDRIQLFLLVCSAVEYAHKHLIVHRDIKPANILVNADGVPKLLDFGIAKILNPLGVQGPDPTITVLRALTPAYASPEQIKGEPITTATDIYSLGVVLYELLVGQHPYRKPGVAGHDVAQAALETEPEKLSTMARRVQADNGPSRSVHTTCSAAESNRLSRKLRGDLDTITLTALRKEPTRRYVSVERFADDLGRYLQRLPVRARSDSVSYRFSRVALRHRAGVTIAAFAVLLLVASIITIVRETQIARTERARAERRFNDVRKLANSLLFEIHDSIKDLQGATPARRLLVSRALEYLDSLSKESSGDPSLQRELAVAYERVGDVQGNPRYANLGDLPGALSSYRKALAIRRTLVAQDPTNVKLKWDLFASYNMIGWALQGEGDLDGALANLLNAKILVPDLSSQLHEARDCDLVAGVHWGIGNALVEKADYSSALDNYRKAASIRGQAGRFTRASVVAPHSLSRGLWRRGAVVGRPGTVGWCPDGATTSNFYLRRLSPEGRNKCHLAELPWPLIQEYGQIS